MCDSVVATLAGAIVGGMIAYFSALCVYRRSAFSQAAAKFRSQFVDEILLLEKGSLDVPRVLTDEAYTKHLKAKAAVRDRYMTPSLPLQGRRCTLALDSRCCMMRNMIQCSHDQVVSAQGTAQAVRGRKHLGHPGQSCQTAPYAVGGAGHCQGH